MCVFVPTISATFSQLPQPCLATPSTSRERSGSLHLFVTVPPPRSADAVVVLLGVGFGGGGVAGGARMGAATGGGGSGFFFSFSLARGCTSFTFSFSFFLVEATGGGGGGSGGGSGFSVGGRSPYAPSLAASIAETLRSDSLYEKLRARARMPGRCSLTTKALGSTCLGGALVLLAGGPAGPLSWVMMPRPRLERCTRSLRFRSSVCLLV